MNREHGLTLVEILIALAIIAIALTAVMRGTAQNLHANSIIDRKTTALWVAQQVLNEASASVRPAENSSGKMQTSLHGQEWAWELKQEATANTKIKKLIVKVFASDQRSTTPTITIESTVYHE